MIRPIKGFGIECGHCSKNELYETISEALANKVIILDDDRAFCCLECFFAWWECSAGDNAKKYLKYHGFLSKYKMEERV